MVEVRQYVDLMGRNAFERWFDLLDATVQSRLIATLDRLSRGSFSMMKGVGHGVHELRMDFGPGYRVYCGRDGETIVILLGGGTKKRQNTDIEAAHELWQEYKKLKREGK